MFAPGLTMRWFHFVQEETVNVAIRQPLYCTILSVLLQNCAVQKLANCHINSLFFDEVKPPFFFFQFI